MTNQTDKPEHTATPWLFGCDPRGKDHQRYYIRKNYDHHLCDDHIAYFEHEGDARLSFAAVTAFDSAAKAMGINAVELAEAMADGGLAEIIIQLRKASDTLTDQYSISDVEALDAALARVNL